VFSTTPQPLYSRERPGTHCTGGWVGPRTGLDVCEKSRHHLDFFVCFVFVRILCLIVLVLDFSMFFLYRTSLFLDCKDR
jgi:hypothetical protein